MKRLSGPRWLSLAGAGLAALGVWLSLPGVEPQAAPARPGDCVRLWVLTNGFHTSLALPAETARAAGLPTGEARWVEVGWGEAAAYQARSMDPLTLARAAVAPGATTLFVWPLPYDPARYRPEAARAVTVSRAGLAVLTRDVAGEVRRDADGRPRVLSVTPDGTFLAAHSPFGLLRPCNVWTAERLRRAGAPVLDRAALTAQGLFAQLARRAPATCGGAA